MSRRRAGSIGFAAMFRLSTGRENDVASGDCISTTDTSNAKVGRKSDLSAVHSQAISSRPRTAGVILIISIWSARPDDASAVASGFVFGRLLRAVEI
jgi:hypothetical protein